MTWLDLVPWRCSCRGTQRQLGYGSSPGVSILGKMDRVVYSQAHVSTVTPDYIEPSFLWSPSSSLAVHIPVQCQLWIAILSHSTHVAKVYRSRHCWIRLWISWLSFSLSVSAGNNNIMMYPLGSQSLRSPSCWQGKMASDRMAWR